MIAFIDKSIYRRLLDFLGTCFDVEIAREALNDEIRGIRAAGVRFFWHARMSPKACIVVDDPLPWMLKLLCDDDDEGEPIETNDSDKVVAAVATVSKPFADSLRTEFA